MRWLAWVVVLAAGCSLVLDPDEDELGGGGGDVGMVDGGAIDGDMIDGGMTDAPGIDAPGEDTGPRPDTGPGPDVGMPDARPVDVGCRMDPVCEGGQVVTCDSVTPCPLGCSPGGEARCAAMVPSNVSEDLWMGDARDLTIDAPGEVVLFDTRMCTSSMAGTRITDQTEGGPEVCVLMVRNLRVTSETFFAARGTRPLVVMATGDVTIEEDGVIDVSAFGTAPGPGGGVGGGNTAVTGGTGDSPGQNGDSSDFGFDDGGGGGGGFCGAGGNGGEGGSQAGGEGGGAIPPTLLIPLSAGSGGGAGLGSFSAGGGNLGLGGAGGGALQISALGTIRIEGFVLAGGGAGGGGGGGSGDWGAGGGGGSGGGVLLEAPSIVIVSGGAVTTSGGGGGGGGGGFGERVAGDDGEDGAFTVGQAAGGARSTERYGADGGSGGGGTVLDGDDGNDNNQGNANGGGAGGGVGCVVYRTLDGSLPAGAAPATSGRVAPSLQRAPIMLR